MSLGTKNGVTYYNDFKSQQSINASVIDNGANMMIKGFLETSWTLQNRSFDVGGYGLRKTKINKGAIFCTDASKLFSLQKGYVGIVLEFEHDIINGVYEPLFNTSSDFTEHILWGVNVGNRMITPPGMYAALTESGILFKIWSSTAIFTITDAYSSLGKNEKHFLEFIWDSDGLDDFGHEYGATMAIRVDDEDIVVGNPPIYNNSLSNISFYALDTPTSYSNLPCIISELIIANETPSSLEEAWWSSSSSSVSSMSSASSASSSSSSSSFSSSSSSSSSLWYSSSSSQSDGPVIGSDAYVVVFSMIDESDSGAPFRTEDINNFIDYVETFPPKDGSRFVGVCVSGNSCQDVYPGPDAYDQYYDDAISRDMESEWSKLKAQVTLAMTDWYTNYGFDHQTDTFYVLFWVDNSGSMLYTNVADAIAALTSNLEISYPHVVIDETYGAGDQSERWIRGMQLAYATLGA